MHCHITLLTLDLYYWLVYIVHAIIKNGNENKIMYFNNVKFNVNPIVNNTLETIILGYFLHYVVRPYNIIYIYNKYCNVFINTWTYLWMLLHIYKYINILILHTSTSKYYNIFINTSTYLHVLINTATYL